VNNELEWIKKEPIVVEFEELSLHLPAGKGTYASRRSFLLWKLIDMSKYTLLQIAVFLKTVEYI
jgi:hypothetical protein